MTFKAAFNLKGLEKYLEDVAQAGVDIDPAADRALVKGAQPIHQEMLRLVPVGDPAEGDEHPGQLKEAIVIEGPHQDGNLHSIEIGVLDANKEVAIYGNVQEYGSPAKNIPAQSYVRAGRDNKRAAAMREIKNSLVNEGFVNP